MTETKTANPGFRLFPKPIQAVTSQGPVCLIATGDVPGHSPSYLTVNENGISRWMPFDEVHIIDTGYLPLSREALRLASRASLGEQSSTR